MVIFFISLYDASFSAADAAPPNMITAMTAANKT